MRNMKDVDNYDHCLIMDFLREWKENVNNPSMEDYVEMYDVPTMQEYVAKNE